MQIRPAATVSEDDPQFLAGLARVVAAQVSSSAEHGSGSVPLPALTAVLGSLAAVPRPRAASGVESHLLHPFALLMASSLPPSSLLDVAELLPVPAVLNLLRAAPDRTALELARGLASSLPPSALHRSPALLTWAVLRAVEADQLTLARSLLRRWAVSPPSQPGETRTAPPLPWDAVRVLFTARVAKGDMSARWLLGDYAASQPRETLLSPLKLLSSTAQALTTQVVRSAAPRELQAPAAAALLRSIPTLPMADVSAPGHAPGSVGWLQALGAGAAHALPGRLVEPPALVTRTLTAQDVTCPAQIYTAVCTAVADEVYRLSMRQSAADARVADKRSPLPATASLPQGIRRDTAARGAVPSSALGGGDISPPFRKAYSAWAKALASLPDTATAQKAVLRNTAPAEWPASRDAALIGSIAPGDALLDEVWGGAAGLRWGREGAPSPPYAAPPRQWSGHHYYPVDLGHDGCKWARAGGVDLGHALRAMVALCDLGFHGTVAGMWRLLRSRAVGGIGGWALGTPPTPHLSKALVPHLLTLWVSQLRSSAAEVQGLGGGGGGSEPPSTPPSTPSSWLAALPLKTRVGRVMSEARQLGPLLRSAVAANVPGVAPAAVALLHTLVALGHGSAGLEVLAACVRGVREGQAGVGDASDGRAPPPPVSLESLVQSMAAEAKQRAAGAQSPPPSPCCVPGRGKMSHWAPCAPQCASAAALASDAGLPPPGCVAPPGWERREGSDFGPADAWAPGGERCRRLTLSGFEGSTVGLGGESTALALSRAMRSVVRQLALPAATDVRAAAAHLHLPLLLHSGAHAAKAAGAGGDASVGFEAAGGSVAMAGWPLPRDTPSGTVVAALLQQAGRGEGHPSPLTLPVTPLWSADFNTAVAPPPSLELLPPVLELGSRVEHLPGMRSPLHSVLNSGIKAALGAGQTDVALAMLRAALALGRGRPGGQHGGVRMTIRHVPPVEAAVCHGLTYACLREGRWVDAFEALVVTLIHALPHSDTRVDAKGVLASIGNVHGQEAAVAAAVRHGPLPGMSQPSAAAVVHFVAERVQESLEVSGPASDAARNAYGAVRQRLEGAFGSEPLAAADAVVSSLVELHEANLARAWERHAFSEAGDSLAADEAAAYADILDE